ncbi:MAG TPA: hypothetical protein VJ603_00550 [Paucimonas sp.]|nr:hypothetical protein [Paucimonas sp.]HJW55649.1 hypothetical protein [Burkholderiaceae bacterium]
MPVYLEILATSPKVLSIPGILLVVSVALSQTQVPLSEQRPDGNRMKTAATPANGYRQSSRGNNKSPARTCLVSAFSSNPGDICHAIRATLLFFCFQISYLIVFSKAHPTGFANKSSISHCQYFIRLRLLL